MILNVDLIDKAGVQRLMNNLFSSKNADIEVNRTTNTRTVQSFTPAMFQVSRDIIGPGTTPLVDFGTADLQDGNLVPLYVGRLTYLVTCIASPAAVRSGSFSHALNSSFSNVLTVNPEYDIPASSPFGRKLFEFDCFTFFQSVFAGVNNADTNVQATVYFYGLKIYFDNGSIL